MPLVGIRPVILHVIAVMVHTNLTTWPGASPEGAFAHQGYASTFPSTVFIACGKCCDSKR
eukprot:scaffold2149_cov406-Prasinococcus_capsulatus_cf.AAC.7